MRLVQKIDKLVAADSIDSRVLGKLLKLSLRLFNKRLTDHVPDIQAGVLIGKPQLGKPLIDCRLRMWAGTKLTLCEPAQDYRVERDVTLPHHLVETISRIRLHGIDGLCSLTDLRSKGIGHAIGEIHRPPALLPKPVIDQSKGGRPIRGLAMYPSKQLRLHHKPEIGLKPTIVNHADDLTGALRNQLCVAREELRDPRLTTSSRSL